MKCRLISLLLIVAMTPLAAQLAATNDRGVTMGHVHLTVRDVDAQRTFWTSIMGGKLVKNGPLELIQFPGAFLVLTQGESSGPPADAIVTHFGFVVKDMPAELAKWKAANLKIEPTENPNESYVNAPDGVRVEVYGDPKIAVPVRVNHIHYYPVDIPAMQAWYAKVFGAVPGQRACVACVSKPRMIDTGDLPGINLSFSQGAKQMAPLKGHSLDHIGFEVKNLDRFVREIEALGVKMDFGPRVLPGTNIKSAFLTDPSGAYIELTEGLAPPAR
jgi:catechol 2,3-dioxygenase-like lactoylglutathione lyase family enzyme